MEHPARLFARLVFILAGWLGLTISDLAMKHGIPREFATCCGIAISVAIAWRACAREVDEPFAVALCLLPRYTYLPVAVLLYCGIGYGDMTELGEALIATSSIGVIVRVGSERTAGERLTIGTTTMVSAAMSIGAQTLLLWDHPIATAAGMCFSIVVVAVFLTGQMARLRERLQHRPHGRPATAHLSA